MKSVTPQTSGENQGKINPDSPRMRLIRLVVGAVIITLGIVIFQLSSKLYAEAEAKDAKEKADREQLIRQITGEDADSLATIHDDPSRPE